MRFAIKKGDTNMYEKTKNTSNEIDTVKSSREQIKSFISECDEKTVLIIKAFIIGMTQGVD